MFQQEIKNNILFKKYFICFTYKKITSIIGYNLLPSEYKYPYDFGYVDKKTNTSLLRKILNT